MNLFDIATLLIIGVSFIFGISSGLISTIIGMVFFFISIILAFYVEDYTTFLIKPYVDGKLTLVIASSLAAFFISMILCSLSVHYIKKSTSEIRGNFFDRLFGGLIGLIRGLGIVLIMLWISLFISLEKVDPKETIGEVYAKSKETKKISWLQHSITLKYIIYTSDKTISQVPDDLKNLTLEEFYKKFIQ